MDRDVAAGAFADRVGMLVIGANGEVLWRGVCKPHEAFWCAERAGVDPMAIATSGFAERIDKPLLSSVDRLRAK